MIFPLLRQCFKCLIYSIPNMKTIYTVITYLFDGIEIFQNDTKSFTTFTEAQNYACNSIEGRFYDIIENTID